MSSSSDDIILAAARRSIAVHQQRGASAFPSAAVQLQQTIHLASLQHHLQPPQHQTTGRMQYMAYPSVVGMPANQSYSSSSYTPQNHNLNMSLQAGQIHGPSVVFQIPTGLINANQACMYRGTSGASGQVYTEPMVLAATMAAAAAAQRTAIHSQVGGAGGPFQTSNAVIRSGGTANTPLLVPPRDTPRKYQDYATHIESKNKIEDVTITSTGKDPSFPMKLHRILSDPEFHDYICWLPHGRSWKVLHQGDFEDKVIPLFFRHGKFASFMRQVNGWGFRRMPLGPEKKSYYHEMFLRGFPHLSAKMRRPIERIKSTSDLKAHPNFNDARLFVALPRDHLVTTDNDSGSGSNITKNDCGNVRDNALEYDNIANTTSDSGADGSGSE